MYAHGGSELRKDTTDGSVLANVLFDDGDVHDGDPVLSACTGTNAVVVLTDAAGHSRAHPGILDDKGVSGRS